MKQFVMIVCAVVFALLCGRSAYAQARVQTCAATGTELSVQECNQATEEAYAKCKGDLDVANKRCLPAPTAAVKPRQVECKENPNNDGKIRRVGKFSCACDQPGYAIGLAGFGAQRCFMVTEPGIAEWLLELRKAYDSGLVTTDQFEKYKKGLNGLSGKDFLSQEEFDQALQASAPFRKLEGRVTAVEKGLVATNDRVDTLTGRINGLEHSKFSFLPSLGYRAGFRPVSGVFQGAEVGFRFRFNHKSGLFVSPGVYGAWGDSTRNGESYSWTAELGLGYCVKESDGGKSCGMSLEAGPFIGAYYANLRTDTLGGNTSSGRGSLMGGMVAFDIRLFPFLGLHAQSAIGGGDDGAVSRNVFPTKAGPVHAAEVGNGIQGHLTVGIVVPLDIF